MGNRTKIFLARKRKRKNLAILEMARSKRNHIKQSSEEERKNNLTDPVCSETTTPRWYLLPMDSTSSGAGANDADGTGVSAAAGGSDYDVPEIELEKATSPRDQRMNDQCSPPRLDKKIYFADSGSDDDDVEDPFDDEDSTDNEDANFLRNKLCLRQEMIKREEDTVTEEIDREELGDEPATEHIDIDIVKMDFEHVDKDMEVSANGLERVIKIEVSANGLERVSKVFQWSDDFASFTGQKETYQRNPGPTFSSQDPVDIFLKFWDDDIMRLIATETNNYARQNIEQYTDPDLTTTIPNYLDQWEEVTIPVLYQYFALMICMSICIRPKFQDYWAKGPLELPMLRQVMSCDAFMLITEFLHFVSDRETTTRGHARKIGKVAPILDHCNQKFSDLYIPSQHISLDESLLCKGSLNWQQCSKRSSKGARIDIKSLELCEATTGYLLKCKLYTGKPMHLESAKVVLDLMDGYLDVGHVLVMDNWPNQLSLTRYLKSRATDVLSTISRTNQEDLPKDLKDLEQNSVARDYWHARHCGDISLVTRQDDKLVNIVSTYHDHQMITGGSAGVDKELPVSVKVYNQYKGGVNLKDQKISDFLFERKQCRKWYLKVFTRLVNTSLLNAFIIYTKNLNRLCSHRDFRRNVAEGLVARFGKVRPSLPASVSCQILRLQPGEHFPVHTEKYPDSSVHKRKACVRCKMLQRRSQVRMLCSLCQVPLCFGKCWADYHTLENLSID